MPDNLQTAAALSREPEWRDRVTSAVIRYAVGVLLEAQTTSHHQPRAVLAVNAINGRVEAVWPFIRICSNHSSIVPNYTPSPDGVIAPVFAADSLVNTLIAQAWNYVAIPGWDGT